MLHSFSVRALKEEDINAILSASGGKIAHEDADSRGKKGADYVIGNAVIELKMLDEEALLKSTHQEKLGDLFGKQTEDRPVVVIDRQVLPDDQRRAYDRIIERPIQGEVRKARKQLPQTRAEYPETTCSILFVCNNGYSSLDHDALKELITHRVRQDTSQIDGIVVAGCYYFSDGFDATFTFPFEYVPVNLSVKFPEFEALQSQWKCFIQQFMFKAMTGETEGKRAIEPAKDLVFHYKGRRFVKPTPWFGPSDFYLHGRPRENSSGIDSCPPVGLVVPGLTELQWQKIVNIVQDQPSCLMTFQNWQKHVDAARGAATQLKPVVSISVEADEWEDWCSEYGMVPSLNSLNSYALRKFDGNLREVMENAREVGSVQPSVCVMVNTQEIGQDKTNDLSSISLVRNTMSETKTRTLISTQQMFHEHALALGAAYAVAESIDTLIWARERKYCWQ